MDDAMLCVAVCEHDGGTEEGMTEMIRSRRGVNSRRKKWLCP